MFALGEFESRVAKARAAMREQGVDVLLVDHAECLAWLTGYTVSETMYRAAFLPLEGEPWFVLRDLDTEPCRARTWLSDVVGFLDTADPQAVMAEELRARGRAAARIGADFRSYGFTAHVRDRFARLLPDASFLDLEGISDRLRAVKSAAEIAVIGKAARIADQTMAVLHAEARPGISAREASAMAAAEFLRRGADTGEVGPVVKAFGDSGFLHGALADDLLGEGDVLHAELIPKVGHYSARLMRPILIGRDRHGLAPTAERLIALQDRQIAAMRSGMRACEVDAILRRAVLAEGLRARYDNVTGYMLGLYGRTPRMSDFSFTFLPTAEWRLEEGMVFHMYVSARGIAFSETVLVGAEGGRRLTSAPRRMLVAGA